MTSSPQDDARNESVPPEEGGSGPSPRDYPPALSTSYAPMPGGHEAASAAISPSVVRMSVKLWSANIALSLIGALFAIVFTDRGQAVQSILDAKNADLTRSQAETAVTVGLVSVGIFIVVVSALQAFFIFKLRNGRNWARITLTVLGALSVLFKLGGGVTVGGLVNIVSIVLIAAAVVLMFRPAANAYFKRPKS